jgi:hypothetical protein
MILITDVIGWTHDGITVVSTSSVEASFVSSTNVRSSTFVDIFKENFKHFSPDRVIRLDPKSTLARSIIGSQSITFRTPARVGTRFIDANTDAEAATVAELLAFIHVLTGATVCAQRVTRLTTALVRAPRVGARVLAQPRSLGTFVDICTAVKSG